MITVINQWLTAQRHSNAYFMGVGSNRHSKRSCQAKVSKFNASRRIQQKVLRFQVTMQDAMTVTEHYGLQ